MDTRDQRGDACTVAVEREGFAFVDHTRMRRLLLDHGRLEDWEAFSGSWGRLGPDPYLAATGRHRLRRYARFEAGEGGVLRMPHQAHYQTLQNNLLQGDLERWFEPVEASIADSACLRAILAFAHDLFGHLAPRVRTWEIEVHQFRIEAAPERHGEPTPEGVHRDGVDYVLVLLIDRHNISSGTTSIHTSDLELGAFTLTHPLDAALVDDNRVFHGVTAVGALDASQPAFRDVLVVTFRHKQATGT